MKIKCSYYRDKIDFLSVCVHVCPKKTWKSKKKQRQ